MCHALEAKFCREYSCIRGLICKPLQVWHIARKEAVAQFENHSMLAALLPGFVIFVENFVFSVLKIGLLNTEGTKQEHKAHKVFLN